MWKPVGEERLANVCPVRSANDATVFYGNAARCACHRIPDRIGIECYTGKRPIRFSDDHPYSASQCRNRTIMQYPGIRCDHSAVAATANVAVCQPESRT